MFYINSTHMHGASKLTQTSLVYQLVKCHKSILKYHSRNLFQKKRITFSEFVMNCPSKTEKTGVGRQLFLLKGVYYEWKNENAPLSRLKNILVFYTHHYKDCVVTAFSNEICSIYYHVREGSLRILANNVFQNLIVGYFFSFGRWWRTLRLK